MVGLDLTVEKCFQIAKQQGLKYAGLQNGKECWGGQAYGHYGKLEEAQCDTICSIDQHIICGSSTFNSIYDLTLYQRSGCSSDTPKDCTDLGGVDLRDPCRQTCKTDFEKQDCLGKCRSNIKDSTPEEYKNCVDTCNGLRTPCPETFVDCTYRGGYFEKDYCRQTCMLPEIGSPAFGLSVEENCNTACKARTLRVAFKDPSDQY